LAEIEIRKESSLRGKQASEKLGVQMKLAENILPGLKPALVLLALCGG
jgi:hypothetical protein